MCQDTLYANFRVRSWVPRCLVRTLNLDVQVVEPESAAKQFSKDFPLKKVPAFIDSRGYKLTEQLAIANYLINLSGDEKMKHQLLGKPDDFRTQAQILRWESLANSDLIMFLVKVFGPLRGDAPYIKSDVDKAMAYVNEIVALFEERLQTHTYLVTEDITLADLIATAAMTRGFNHLFGEKWRAEHPAILRWFNTVRDSKFLKDEYADFQFIEKPAEPPVNKKKQQKQQAKMAEPPKKKEAAEPQTTPAKKPKHPLAVLGEPTFVLDDWKRKYSNEDTRPVALPWFWEHYNPDEYSIWRVDYKYNDELTLTFMSNNLIGGFFNRLSASVKYVFGAMVVYGENNNNGIVGAVMIRGQDYVPAFDVAPDWESYSYKKLDPSKDEDKAFIENMWAWDKPVVVNGDSKEISDGKVLK
ncbi:hypothetical protein HG535_0C01370 [Zygotorulaspora mrakii]|uniref:Elongation factor 1-gamma 1 n=1 Tax=Zygotorulaspora mrakii TaxID=42260 RepID=A0A7H9AZK5_ZYGMR|nr:uncharacterized protein HG535_0C01370 [Zygotorulaspora mrakii]QLG71788.1 hypothetical protein HG535_0C01370 [Zygotorulaspora mrakii]